MMMDIQNYGFQPVDIAVEDDRRQSYLAAKEFIFVDELTEDKVTTLLSVA